MTVAPIPVHILGFRYALFRNQSVLKSIWSKLEDKFRTCHACKIMRWVGELSESGLPVQIMNQPFIYFW